MSDNRDGQAARGRCYGKDAIAFGIDEGLIGESAVTRIELGRIVIHRASGTATAEVASPPDAKGKFEFDFEFDDGRWRIDIAALIDLAHMLFRTAFERSGLKNEEQFLAALVESSTGKKLSESLWTPTRELTS